MRMARLSLALLAGVGCDVPFGVGHWEHTPDAVVCDPGKSTDDPEGCACESVSAVQACYLGAHAQPTSRCFVGGTVTCGPDHLWSACVGAMAPIQELCFDGTDADCDGIIDNGCTCNDASNMCLDPATSQPFASQPSLVFYPSVVSVNGPFNVYGMSRDFEVVGASFKSDRGYCTGPGSMDCSVGGACAGWSIGAHAGNASVGVSPAMFAAVGVHTGTFLVGDNGADPCNINMQPPHKITGGSITVQ